MYVSQDEVFWSRARLAGLIARASAARAGQPLVPPEIPEGLLVDHELKRRGRWQYGSPIPVFGGTDENKPERRRPSRKVRTARLKVRALLFANPETPVSTEEVSNVLGIREGDVRAARPTTARKVGRAYLAPFGHWLQTLRAVGLLPSWPDEVQPLPEQGACPRQVSPRSRCRSRGSLVPLGGPGGRRGRGGTGRGGGH